MRTKGAWAGRQGRSGKVLAIYEILYRHFGPQGWWPVTAVGEAKASYSGGPAAEGQRFEVAAGAVLTQNTSWLNASRAVENLVRSKVLAPASIASMETGELAELIRPSGYFNRKAAILKTLAVLFIRCREITRESLLALPGIGPETADSIMLYAFGRPFFVVDAYTMRVFSRLGFVDPRDGYEEVRSFFERNLPVDAAIYQEYHALIVALSKRFCKKKPECASCPVFSACGRNCA